MQLTILVVDDDPSVRKSLLRLLRSHGYAAVGAADGSEALRQALERHPQLILMDLVMPSPGVDVTRDLRNHPALLNIPIIALSASPAIADSERSLFRKVLAKPCPSDVLLEAIAEVVG